MNAKINDDGSIEDIFFSFVQNLITSNLPKVDFVNNQYTIFEMLLFHSCYIIKQFVSASPKLADAFAKSYSLNLYKFASVNNILDNLPCDFNAFIKSRLAIYIAETELLLSANNDSTIYLPGKLLYLFYDEPLSLNDGFNKDMLAYLDIMIMIKHNFRAINKFYDYLIEEKII